MGRLVFVVALVMVAIPGSALARPSGLKGHAGTGEVRVAKDPIELTTTPIEGRVLRPSVFFVLARANLNYQGLQFAQDFTPRIEKAALKRPF